VERRLFIKTRPKISLKIWLQKQTHKLLIGRTIAQAVSRCFTLRGRGFDPRSGYVGFVVDKVALGQIFSYYFGFPCQSSFNQLLHIHHHLSSGAGTIGQ
jgi:hypothetical protein